MSISSARPDNLDDFSRQSQQLDGDLQSSLRMLLAAFNAFESANQWGAFDARSLLLAYGRHLQGNDFTVRWVAGIAATFRAAGAGGSIVRLPDAAIKASLKAAGLDHGRHHDPADDGLHARSGQHRDGQLRRARARPGVRRAGRRPDVRAHVQQPFGSRGPVRSRMVLVGERQARRAARRRGVRRPRRPGGGLPAARHGL
jgi:hypothetical protein